MNNRMRKWKPTYFFKNDPRPHINLPNHPIMLAILEGEFENVKQLLEISKESIQDALWVAVAYRQTKIAAYLLEIGANPDAASSLCRRMTMPLQIAIAVPNNYDCVLLLLRHDANAAVKTNEGKALWELAGDILNYNLVTAFVLFNQSIEEFSTSLPYPNLAFISALFLDPKLVFKLLGDMVEATNAVEGGALEEHPLYSPAFLRFSIRQLILLVETKEELFKEGWLWKEFEALSFHLNAYDTSHADQNPYALFRSVDEKIKMLHYFEMGTGLGERKSQYKDKFKPPG